jgi:hypothetical protein
MWNLVENRDNFAENWEKCGICRKTEHFFGKNPGYAGEISDECGIKNPPPSPCGKRRQKGVRKITSDPVREWR